MEFENLELNNFPRIEANLNLKFSLKLLRLIGNWPPIRDDRRKYYYVYALTCLGSVIAAFMFVQVAFMFVAWGNVEKMIAGSFLLMTNAGNCYKMFVVLAHRRRIQSLVDIVDSDFFQRTNHRYEAITSYYAWQGILHHFAYQSLGGVSIFCWALDSIKRNAESGDRRLPIESWYPYDTKKSPNFEITFAKQIMGEIILCLHNIALDTLVTNLICVACCQLEILKKNVSSIGKDHPESFDAATAMSNDEAREKLYSCIEHNKTIIGFKKEIQEIFGTSILYQCSVNCAIICLTAFHISRMSEYVSAELMGTGLYLCGMAYQIFIYCWHGNELTLHSESVALAAYSGNWWKFDERYKSTLRIFMIRSRRPLVIVIGRIMTLSLETFTSIFQQLYKTGYA